MADFREVERLPVELPGEPLVPARPSLRARRRSGRPSGRRSRGRGPHRRRARGAPVSTTATPSARRPRPGRAASAPSGRSARLPRGRSRSARAPGRPRRGRRPGGPGPGAGPRPRGRSPRRSRPRPGRRGGGKTSPKVVLMTPPRVGAPCRRTRGDASSRSRDPRRSESRRSAARRPPGSDWVFLPEASVLLRPAPDLDFHTPAQLAKVEQRLLGAERRRARRGRTAPGRRGRRPPRYRADRPRDVLSRGGGGFGPSTRAVAASVLATVATDLRAGRLQFPDEVVYLDAPPATLRRRASEARGTHPAHLLARHWTVGAVERSFWETLSQGSPGSVRMVRIRGDRRGRRAAGPRGDRRTPAGAPRRRRRSRARAGPARAPGAGNVTLKKGAPSRRLPRR